MKKQLSLILLFSAFFSVLLISCSKEESSHDLTEQDQKEIILTIFNAGSSGVEMGMNNSTTTTKSALSGQASVRNSYPLNYSGTYDYPDGKGGNIHLTISLGGAINYNPDPYQCLGGVVLVNVTEQINHFRVQLTNGREVYLDTDKSVVFSGNFALQAGCTTFDAAKSTFNLQGMYKCNGIEYDVTLIGFINSDGTCDRISGVINGIPISLDY
ncbi:MAG: hypothetical protein PHO94_10415 [Petrimonas sp.]|nr:hypothetical protein [Petrimonas sp.]